MIFLCKTDLALALWRDGIETTTAGIPFYRHNSKAIAVSFYGYGRSCTANGRQYGRAHQHFVY